MRLVRQFRLGDYATIAKIEAAAFESSADAREQIKHTIDSFEEGIFLDWKNRGYLMTVLADLPSTARELPPWDRCSGAEALYCTNMAVLPRFQGQGIGRRMLCAALDRFQLPAFLTVHVFNEGALSLYHSLGFRCYDIVKKFIDCSDDGMQDAYLMKRLWRPISKAQREG